MVLDATWLNTQHYKVRIKGKGKGVAPPFHLGVVVIEREALGSPSTTVTNFTLLTDTEVVWKKKMMYRVYRKILFNFEFFGLMVSNFNSLCRNNTNF